MTVTHVKMVEHVWKPPVTKPTNAGARMHSQALIVQLQVSNLNFTFSLQKRKLQKLLYIQSCGISRKHYKPLHTVVVSIRHVATGN